MPTPIVLKADGVQIPATLNDTVAAKAFFGRLPLTVSGYRCTEVVCCRIACGVFDPDDMQSTWRKGDICLSGCWLQIRFGGEEAVRENRGMMIIAHIDQQHLPLVEKLQETLKLTIEAAETAD